MEKIKILIYTPSFYPIVGGLETINYLIAKGLSKHFDITVLTPVLDYDKEHEYNFRIVRTKSVFVLFKEYIKCDIFVHSVLSLKGVFPLLLFPKRWIAIHHTCYFKLWHQNETLQSRMKRLFSYFSNNVCVSAAVGKNLGMNQYTVIHNSYNNALFKNYGNREREGFVFVGRLVTEKGVDFLIKAYLKYLLLSRKKQKLYIVGDGPMKESYHDVASDAIEKGYIIFMGQLQGQALVDELNMRYCMIVPSVYKEAFGIVALEGLATGCHVIVSDGDGLSEAIGDCGLLFEKGNTDDLVEKMLEVDNARPIERMRVEEHLKKFSPEFMIKKYIDYFNKWQRK